MYANRWPCSRLVGRLRVCFYTGKCFCCSIYSTAVQSLQASNSSVSCHVMRRIESIEHGVHVMSTWWIVVIYRYLSTGLPYHHPYVQLRLCLYCYSAKQRCARTHRFTMYLSVCSGPSTAWLLLWQQLAACAFDRTSSIERVVDVKLFVVYENESDET